jgi:hypothetical protein
MNNPIGQKVIKKSGKPFKSGLKTNIVKSMVPHPFKENSTAYAFYEDDSYVSVELCIVMN